MAHENEVDCINGVGSNYMTGLFKAMSCTSKQLWAQLKTIEALISTNKINNGKMNICVTGSSGYINEIKL